jgi:hypothetical protein
MRLEHSRNESMSWGVDGKFPAESHDRSTQERQLERTAALEIF